MAEAERAPLRLFRCMRLAPQHMHRKLIVINSSVARRKSKRNHLVREKHLFRGDVAVQQVRPGDAGVRQTQCLCQFLALHLEDNQLSPVAHYFGVHGGVLLCAGRFHV
jgi:hypothetical protein